MSTNQLVPPLSIADRGSSHSDGGGHTDGTGEKLERWTARISAPVIASSTP